MTTKQGLGIRELLADQREAILRLAERHGATNVRVFGSVARGEASPSSDIDFLVVFKPGCKLWDHIGLKQDLEDLLHRRVDVVNEPYLREELRADVLAEVVPL
jgi:hypothetical protein